MRNPITIKIISSSTLFVVFLITPLTSHADMLGALQKLERDSQRREQSVRPHTPDSHLLKKPEKCLSMIRAPQQAIRNSQQARRPQPQNRTGRIPQRIQGNRPAFWSALKVAYHNRVPEFRKLSKQQARQERAERPRPPKTPERILDKFVARIQHSTVMTDVSTAQHVPDEQAVEPVAISLLDHQSSPSFSERSSLPGTQPLYSLSVLRL